MRRHRRRGRPQPDLWTSKGRGMTATAENAVRALLADGRVVGLRELFPADEADVLDLHRRLSERDHYLRFFSPTVPLGDVARRITRAADGKHAALGAYLDGALIGVANYEVVPDE